MNRQGTARRAARLAGAVSLLLASAGAAQIVNPAVLVATPGQTGGDNSEVAITSSPLSPNEPTVVWQLRNAAGNRRFGTP